MKKIVLLLLVLLGVARGDILSTTDTTATVTTTSSVVLAAANRQDATIVNTGASACYLSRGNTAVSTKGVYLAANGGFYNIDVNNVFRGAISAVTAAGSTTLVISEGK